MTIEQEFYKCFEIKKRDLYGCGWQADCPYGNLDCKECPYYEKYATEYPLITDRILLELICINSAFGGIEIRHTYTIEELKNAMLEHTIERYGYSLNKKKYFEQVQQLFKENE